MAVDFKGPIGENHKYILVCMDEFSRYPEIEIIPSTNEKYLIPKFEKIFSTHGIPITMKSDNGPPFNGSKMKEFAKQSFFCFVNLFYIDLCTKKASLLYTNVQSKLI